MEINQITKIEITTGTLVKIKGTFNDWIVIDIQKEDSQNRERGDDRDRTFMQCININELKLLNPQVYEFTIKDLSSMSGDREINSNDISVVGFKEIKKIVNVQYVAV